MATEKSIEQGLFYLNASLQAWAVEVGASGQIGVFGDYTQRIDTQGANRAELHYLANPPIMQEWLGARQHKTLRHYSLLLVEKYFEASLRLSKAVLRGDINGVFNSILPQFKQQADVYDAFIGTLFYSASGAGPTAVDSAALFSASHPHSPTGGNQSNIGSGTNLSHAALAAAEAVMGQWKFENGRYVSPTITDMHVGFNLKRRALELAGPIRVVGLSSGDAEGGTSVSHVARPNTFEGEFRVTVDPRAGTTYYWTLIDGTKATKPMVMIDTQPLNAVERTDETDPHVYNHREVLLGVDAAFNAGAGDWHTCWRGTGTA